VTSEQGKENGVKKTKTTKTEERKIEEEERGKQNGGTEVCAFGPKKKRQ